MKAQKLTTMERRAKNFCDDLTRYDGGTVNVEWRKSSCYGYCPAVMYNGEKVAYASGCGYDKISAALAEALHFLIPDGLHGCSGCGVSTVKARLAEHGWSMEQTASGDTFDAFRLTRAA